MGRGDKEVQGFYRRRDQVRGSNMGHNDTEYYGVVRHHGVVQRIKASTAARYGGVVQHLSIVRSNTIEYYEVVWHYGVVQSTNTSAAVRWEGSSTTPKYSTK